MTDLLRQFSLFGLQLSQPVGVGLDLGLDGLGLLQLGGVLFGLAHQHTYLLGQGVPVGSQLIGFADSGPVLLVQCQYLVHQGQFGILKLFLDIFPHCIGVFTNKFDIQHGDRTPFLS